VGRRQSDAALTSAKAAHMNAQTAGRHTVAEFPQKWIDKVIDVLGEHHSIVMTSHDERTLSLEDKRKLAALRAKLEILLNPDEADTVALLKLMDIIAQSQTVEERTARDDDGASYFRKLLKREWVRIKTELQ
jgi:hypothetical protein